MIDLLVAARPAVEIGRAQRKVDRGVRRGLEEHELGRAGQQNLVGIAGARRQGFLHEPRQGIFDLAFAAQRRGDDQMNQRPVARGKALEQAVLRIVM